MCTHETDHVSEIEMTVCVIYAYHMKAYISRWLDAGLQYLQCDDDEDAAVLHKSVHFVYGQGPGAWRATGLRLYSWWPYVYPRN